MIYKAVVFDLDGTLLDTLEDLADSMNRVLEFRGLPVHPTEAFRSFVGNGASTLVRRALPWDLRDDGRVAECLDAFLEEYDRNWNIKTKLYDGVAVLLDRLVERGLPLAILTNKPQRHAELCVQEFLNAWPFVLTLGQRPGVPVKPDPAAPHEIATRLDLAVQDIIFVGDSDVDMLTGVNAGMFPVGAKWGFRTEAELHKAGAGATIGHPEELLRFLA